MNDKPSLLHLVLSCVVVATSMAITANAAADGKDILETTGVKGGLVVHIGCGDGRLTSTLLANEKYLVHGLALTEGALQKSRAHVTAQGVYGKVSVALLSDKRLPYADNLVNLVVSDRPTEVPDAEVMRVLRPLGVYYRMKGDAWEKTVKPWPEGMSEWPHYLNGSDNNAVAEDTAIGQPRSLQWVGPPRWLRTHEELASISCLVSARGRLFYIVDEAPLISLRYPAEWKLVACDAFNGKRFWEKPITGWIDHLRHFRSGPAHLPRRLVAAGERVFVTLGLAAPVTMLDAATGKLLNTFKGTERAEEIMCHKGKLFVMVGTSEIVRAGEGLMSRGEPEATKERFLAAFDIESGKELWRNNAAGPDYIMPLSVCASGSSVFYHCLKGIRCVDASTGQQRWLTPKQTLSRRYAWSTSTLVVKNGVVLCADRSLTSKEGKAVGPAKDGIAWGVTCFNIKPMERKGTNILTAYSAKDGKQLWTGVPCHESYNSPIDVFVIGSEVWPGATFNKGYDLLSGKATTTLTEKRAQVGMVHDRCYRNKATSNYIFTGKDGIEAIDVKKGWVGNNSWVRGTCQYGILPCNGLIYAPPDACGCHNKTKLQGMNALSSRAPSSVEKAARSPDRLVRGPAYGRAADIVQKNASLPATDWCTYRKDFMRSGATSAQLGKTIKKLWSAKIGGHLTQAVISAGITCVAAIDAHTVHAFKTDTGEAIWRYMASSRIDSSPTLYRGLVIFGSADGHVYCLDGKDGALIWRFRAAPEARLISVHGQLESSWPVHGSILAANDGLIFTAGRSSYLDGGLHFFRLDPITGKILASNIITHIDPATNKQTAMEKRGTFDSEGSLSDILSTDGTSIFLKHITFDMTGKEIPTTKPRLYSPTGMLNEEWFIRTYWLYGTDNGAGYFRWANMKSGTSSLAPAGRILCFNDQHVYGYGRKQHLGSWAGHRNDTFHLFGSVKEYKGTQGKKGKGKAAPKTFIWSKEDPHRIRALVLAGDKLVAVGLPAIEVRQQKTLAYENPDKAKAALLGKLGSHLIIISAKDGATLTEMKLDDAPVFDGLSATTGKVFLSLKSGELTCFGVE